MFEKKSHLKVMKKLRKEKNNKKTQLDSKKQWLKVKH